MTCKATFCQECLNPSPDITRRNILVMKGQHKYIKDCRRCMSQEHDISKTLGRKNWRKSAEMRAGLQECVCIELSDKRAGKQHTAQDGRLHDNKCKRFASKDQSYNSPTGPSQKKLASPQCNEQQDYHDQHDICCDLHINRSEKRQTPDRSNDYTTQHGCNQEKHTDK